MTQLEQAVELIRQLHENGGDPPIIDTLCDQGFLEDFIEERELVILERWRADTRVLLACYDARGKQ